MRIASLLTAASATMIAAMLAAPVSAQEQAEPEITESSSNAIIVTARRRDEALSDVPASITVFTADAIQRTGIEIAEQFVQLTPGVTIITGTAEAGDTQINIRGINGARDAESSVALVVDGILKTNTAQLNQNQGTLRQIEVLKGPQGAIYGRNAAAGAIVMQTLKPSGALEGGIEVSAAQQETYRANAYLSIPVGEDAGFVLSGNYFKSDGFFRNSFLGNSKTIDDQEIWAVDGRFVAMLGPRTEIDAKARYADLTGASINFNSTFHLPNFAAANPAFFADVNQHRFGFYSNIRPTNDQSTFDASIKLEHEFDTAKLTAWGLYSNVKQQLTADGTAADFARFTFPGATPASVAASNACFASTAELTGFPTNPPTFVGATPVPFIFDPVNGSTFGPYSPTTCDGTQFQVRNQEDFSGEIRLSSTGDGPLSWQVGAYYLNIARDVGVSIGADLGQGVIRQLFNAPDSANPTSQLFSDRFNTDVYAAFGSAEYNFSDTVNLGLALRYDIEDRRVSNRVPVVSDPITGGPINPGQIDGPIPDKSTVFRQLQPKASLRWAVSPDVNIYGNWGVGFKAGGFNNSGSAAIVDQSFNQFIGSNVLITDDYRKETSSAFEAGIKGSAANGRITFDLAGYYTNVTDMQFFEFFVGGFGLLRVVSNIDDVEIYGGELNLNAEIVPGWNLFGAFNAINSTIKANSSRPETVGNKAPSTADYTINLGSQIVAPLSRSLDLVVRADYRITGPTWFHTLQDNTVPTIFSGLLPGSALALPAFVGDANYAVTQREAFGVLNLRAGVESNNWRVTAFAENMLDRRYLNEVITAAEFGGSFISPGGLRRIGVELAYTF